MPENKDIEKLELRSEEVQEILTTPPLMVSALGHYIDFRVHCDCSDTILSHQIP